MSRPALKQEIRLQGLGASPGIASGPAEFVGRAVEEPEHLQISEGEVESEKESLAAAFRATRSQILKLQKQIDSSSDESGIFDAHLLFLEDPTVTDEVIRLIQSEFKSAAWAYSTVIKRYIESLRKTADTYLRERAIDIEDVAQRVLKNLQWPDGKWQQLAITYEQPIVFAHDLSPSETVGLDRTHVRGFATETGSFTSHSAIMARSLNLPAVVALHTFPENCSPGDTVLIDGYHGLVILNPSPQTQQEYQKLAQQESRLSKELKSLTSAETRTADGRKLTLSANIEFQEELDDVFVQGAEGVGLFRTEFLYLEDAESRNEDRQTEIYSKVAKSTAPHGVIIRTVDIGGDKFCPELYGNPEPNPFLGWRGIRLSLDNRDEFKIQIRAILRASACGKVRAMFPFVSHMEEILQANQVVDECKNELRKKGIAFDEKIEVGAMIEIPSAALITEHMAKVVDFFSIGTNDLVQYTTAVDRVNDRVANLYRPMHPSVISLIETTVKAAHHHGIWCGICGEAASDLTMTPIWVGLEIDELSVGAAQLLKTRRAISRLDTAVCRELINQIHQTGRARDVEKICDQMARSAYPEMLL